MRHRARKQRFDKQKPTPAVQFLDHLDTQRLCSSLTAYIPSLNEIAALVEQAEAEIPALAGIDVIQVIARHNPDCFWGVRPMRLASSTGACGFVAFLMLNGAGRSALLSGTLNLADPSPEFLSRQQELPAAIYVWALHAPGGVTPALGLVMDKLQSPSYQHADFIARAASQEGALFLQALGFAEQKSETGILFHHYCRQHGSRQKQLSLQHKTSKTTMQQTNRSKVTIKIVNSFEEFLQITAIRSVVYVGEERCPVSEEFDGNDFSSTHVLAKVAGEPAGALRIRYFAEFAKIERLAVRSKFRRLAIASDIVPYAIALCRTMGYATLYILARKDKVTFWSRFGFEQLETPSFLFSNYQYVEMRCDVEAHASPITFGLDPFVIIRREE